MSYEDPDGAYTTSTESESPGATYAAGYSPYSSDENLSTLYFKSNISTTSHQTDDTEAPIEREDPYVWNNRFQEALKNVRLLEVETVQHKRRVKIWRKMFSTAADFIHSATTYGKIIISEAYLPASEKTITPLSGRGIAGGEKYIVNSIMFKFAIDSSNLFEGDDHKASRVAGHDLLGYNCFVAAGIEEINTPLVCLLDYRGFRLVAMSLLPIGRDTLVYGSDDAGARIKTDSIVHDILLKCSQWMNTAPHDVVEMKTLHKKRLATALDVEVHRSQTDQRLYVVDVSRVMPASAICRDPAYRGQCNHLTMLLRPELVRYFPRPLCNDAFSSFLLPKPFLKRAIEEQERRRNNTGEGANKRKVAKMSVQNGSHLKEVGDDTDDSNFDGYASKHVEQATAQQHKKWAYSGEMDAHVGYFGVADEYHIGYEEPEPSSHHSKRESYAENAPSPLPSRAATPKPNTPHTARLHSSEGMGEEEPNYALMMEELASQKSHFEEDIQAATARLRSDTVPKFAAILEKIFTQLPPVQQCAFAYDWIVVLLHWHGINIRHLGAVRACVRTENATLRSLLLNLMVSRVLKNMSHHRLRMKMRELRYAGEVPYQQCLVTFMNLVFGTSAESLSFWNMHIKHALIYQFPDGLLAEEKEVDLKTLILDQPIIALEDLKSSLKEPSSRQGSNPFLVKVETASNASPLSRAASSPLASTHSPLTAKAPSSPSVTSPHPSTSKAPSSSTASATSTIASSPRAVISTEDREEQRLAKYMGASIRRTNTTGISATSKPAGASTNSPQESVPTAAAANVLPPTPVFVRPPLLHRNESSEKDRNGSSDSNLMTHSGVSSPNVSQVFSAASTSSAAPSNPLRSSRDENAAKVVSEMPMDPVCFLFFNFCRLIGVKWKAGHMGSFASNPALFQVAEPVNFLDLDGAPEKVKTLQVVSLAEGQVWKVRAEAATSLPKSKQFAYDLWKLALEAYKSSLLANPRDQRTLRNAAEVYHAIGLLELAGVLAHLAIETNPDDSVSLYKYATYLWSSTANPERAKRYFEAAIRAPNATPGAILAYAAFEVQRHNIPEAIALVSSCLERFPTSWDAHFKMANMLQYHVKDYPKAAKYYKFALDMESDDLTLLRHYVSLLKKLEPVDTALVLTYELYIKKLEQKANIAGHRTKTFYSNIIVPN